MDDIDLSSCSDVAKRELAYMHDTQFLLQSLCEFFYGKGFSEENIFVHLSKKVSTSSDYMNRV